MNSRFIFRCWDKKSKQMLQDCIDNENLFLNLSTGGLESEQGPIGEGWYDSEDDRYILMQCTGVEDKHHKLIFEGDILKADGIGNLHVYWQPVALAWQCHIYTVAPNRICDIGICALYHSIYRSLEVIGNIYENPELLRTQE